jgi:hypothetical protein
MKTTRNRTIRNETIVLDDVEFRDCEFVNCQLKYSGGEFKLDGVRLSGNCYFTFDGPAQRTIRFLQWAKILSGDPSKWVILPDQPDTVA